MTELNQSKSGPQDGDGLQDCQTCYGTGRYMGRFGHNDPDCPNCRGSGKVQREPDEMEMAAELERRLKAPQPNPDAAEGAEAARLLRGWAKAYRDTPEYRFPSDPNAEFFPVDLERAAYLLAAPPKPAPDAMRDDIARLIYEAGSPFSPKYAWKEAFRVTDSILDLLNK